MSAIGWTFLFGMIWGMALMAGVVFLGSRLELDKRKRKVRKSETQTAPQQAKEAA